MPILRYVCGGVISDHSVTTIASCYQLMGTWYSASRLAAASSWHAGVVNFDLLEDGNVLAKHGGARLVS